jgi:hypothetical protein
MELFNLCIYSKASYIGHVVFVWGKRAPNWLLTTKGNFLDKVLVILRILARGKAEKSKEQTDLLTIQRLCKRQSL